MESDFNAANNNKNTLSENNVLYQKFRTIILCVAILGVISVVIMLKQITSKNYFSCNVSDTHTYTSWAWQFIQGLKEGSLYPRWLALDFWGYGKPVFVYYPPLAFYITALCAKFTNSVVLAMNITKLFSLYLTSIGIYFFTKEFYRDIIAVLSAAFYVVMPYTVYQYYISGSFASSISLMWFPFILLFLNKFNKTANRIYVMYAGICYGCLILTHIINAYIFTFVLIAFVIYQCYVNEKPQHLLAIPLIIVVAFSVSSAYILPLLFENKFIHHSNFIASGSGGFNYSDFFIIPNLSHKYAGLFWCHYYYIYIQHILIFLVLTYLFYLQPIKKQADCDSCNYFFTSLVITSVFFQFGISGFIWELIPYFKYIQFPVRWLNITGFSVAFLSASFFARYETMRATKGYVMIFMLLFTCFWFSYGYIVKNIDGIDIIKEKGLTMFGAVNSTVEHLPAGVDINKLDRENNFEAVHVIQGEGTARIVSDKSEEKTLKIVASKALTIRMKTFNFTGWTAYIDDIQSNIRTENGTGAMLVDVPEGAHLLKIVFKDTYVRLVSKCISFVAWLVFGFIAIFNMFNLIKKVQLDV